ncbi:MAG: macro domain-containing protein [Armatimonadetes bacterium]|nr:macro domain-containing protein [Armatimonadota bacterium]
MRREVGPLVLEVLQGDITQADTEAIVNAANNHLWMGAGVAGAIKRAGGPEVEREAVAKGPIPIGAAVETTAGNLPHKYVIHGAVMGQDLRTDAGLIAETTRSCLELAEGLGLESVALPAFGTGVGGFPVDDCATVMVREVVGFATRARSLRRIAVVLFGDEAWLAFRRATNAALGN